MYCNRRTTVARTRRNDEIELCENVGCSLFCLWCFCVCVFCSFFESKMVSDGNNIVLTDGMYQEEAKSNTKTTHKNNNWKQVEQRRAMKINATRVPLILLCNANANANHTSHHFLNRINQTTTTHLPNHYLFDCWNNSYKTKARNLKKLYLP